MKDDYKIQDRSLIAVQKERGLVVRSAALAKRGLESLNTLGRVVSFPSDISIGDVYLFDRNSEVIKWAAQLFFGFCLPYFHDYELEKGEVEKIANIQGDLRISNGKFVVLDIDDVSKLPLLSSLAPNSLQGLRLLTTYIDLDVPYFGHLSDLRLLMLKGVKSADEFLSRISRLNVLSHLDLAGADVTDGGLTHLSAVKSLSYLDLSMTKTTDHGLSHLSNLSSLTYLGLNETQVTNNGLPHLSNLTSLTHLDLGCTKVTDDGLSHLSNLTSITYLGFEETGVSDEGLSNLSDLSSLVQLDLSSTKITDAGLFHLADLKSLKDLAVYGTEVSERGIQELKASLPDCNIL